MTESRVGKTTTQHSVQPEETSYATGNTDS